MKFIWIALVATGLAACQMPTARQGGTFDRISQELQEAANGRAKPTASDSAVGRAMLPPLQLEASAPTPVAKAEPRFDLAVNNAPASQIFMALVSGTPYSMLFTPELSGTMTLNLKNVTMREALEAIRELYGYEFNVKGTRIFIQPNTMQTRMFQINYLSSQRQGRTDVRVTSSSAALANASTATAGQTAGGTGAATPSPGGSGGAGASGTESSRITTQSTSDFWKDLNATLAALVGTTDGRAVIVNAHSGVLLVKAMPGEMRAVENYLKATQLIVERQVMIEAKIVDVQLNEGSQSGVNWSKFGGANNKWAAGNVLPGTRLETTGAISGNSAGGTPTSVVPGGAALGSIVAGTLGKGFFGLAFQSKDFAALLSFLETQGDVQVLSSPRVATINNQKAVLKVGTDDFFVTNVSTTSTTNTSGAATVSPTITLQPFFSGVALDVMPQIDEDNNIILHIHPSVSNVQEKNKVVDLGSAGVFTLPLASSNVSETDSVVRVQDGNIVAIGGLMTQEQTRDSNGLPYLSRAPGLLGGLFGQKSASFTKRELVILLKPTVIQGENAWRQDLMETQVRVQEYDPRKKAVDVQQ